MSLRMNVFACPGQISWPVRPKSAKIDMVFPVAQRSEADG